MTTLTEIFLGCLVLVLVVLVGWNVSLIDVKNLVSWLDKTPTNETVLCLAYFATVLGRK